MSRFGTLSGLPELSYNSVNYLPADLHTTLHILQMSKLFRPVFNYCTDNMMWDALHSSHLFR